MKEIRNSMTILFLLSFCILFVFAASVPMLQADYGKYPVSTISISTIPDLTRFWNSANYLIGSPNSLSDMDETMAHPVPYEIKGTKLNEIGM